MDVLIDIFSQYSIETILLLLIAIGFAIKFVSELWEFFYTKLRNYFNIQTQKDQRHGEILNGIESVKDEITSIKQENAVIEEKISSFETQIGQLNERVQENTRSFIIDKHHYFCYTVGTIDDLNLQSLERHYLYYKAAGGDSFIDGLMEEIRALPRLRLQDKKVIQAIHERGEE